MANNPYLYDDLMVTLAALCMLYVKPIALTKNRPTDNLFDPVVVYSIISQVMLCVLFFFLNLGVTTGQSSWFCSIANATKNLNLKYEPIDPKMDAKLIYPCYKYTSHNIELKNQTLLRVC